MSDAEFDHLASKYDFDSFTEGTLSKKYKHVFRMYSLKKVFDEEDSPLEVGKKIETPKLDGAAVSLHYNTQGILVSGATRGDGIEGEDITDKVYKIATIPKSINIMSSTGFQISGEIVVSKKIENARNYASGALHIKDKEKFEAKKEKLVFVAYNINPFPTEEYESDMRLLEKEKFITVLDDEYCSGFFPTDGRVIRLNSNVQYDQLGSTAKHPRGAYARKLSSDVPKMETTLLKVTWQVGRTGRVTPVGHFKPIVIDDATITKATLNNVGFITDMDLALGDTILVTRSGGIIPKILGKL